MTHGEAIGGGDVLVSAPARLHFGMLDPLGAGARRFGGVGVCVQAPRVLVAVRATAGGIEASGPQGDRAAEFARRARASFGHDGGVAVEVREAIPAHSGLGSGTKLGLSVACGVAALAGQRPAPGRLAQASGRGGRSSVGCWTFAQPGLVVEAGAAAEEAISPLVTRCAVPERWRCVLALPRDASGLSGEAEERFFARRVAAPGPVAEPAVSRLVLTGLLPGLLEADIDEFGRALAAIQREVGAIFADRQGGVFHPRAAPVVDALAQLGVTAVGQSSWGPAVYGIVDGADRAAAVADRLREARGIGVHTDVTVVDFDRRGATVSRVRAAA